MRYIVRKPDGRYVAMMTHSGLSSPTTYATSTPDARDAHDFGSMPAAQAWLRTHGPGKALELTDGGYWPLED